MWISERCKLQYFFQQNGNNCVRLIYQETVAVYKEFNVRRQYQTKHANAYDKLSDNNHAEKNEATRSCLGLTTAVLHAGL